MVFTWLRQKMGEHCGGSLVPWAPPESELMICLDLGKGLVTDTVQMQNGSSPSSTGEKARREPWKWPIHV